MSDLLIRGFRLPKYDSVTITIYPNGVVKRFNEKTSHPPKIFRATQLPPHGRLIDVDALIESFAPSEIGYDMDDEKKLLECCPIIIPADKEKDK